MPFPLPASRNWQVVLHVVPLLSRALQTPVSLSPSHRRALKASSKAKDEGLCHCHQRRGCDLGTEKPGTCARSKNTALKIDPSAREGSVPTVQALRAAAPRGGAGPPGGGLQAGQVCPGEALVPCRPQRGPGFAPRHAGSGVAPAASGPDTPCLFNVPTYGNLNGSQP